MSKTYRHCVFNPFLTKIEEVLYQAKPTERFVGVVPYDTYNYVAVFETDDGLGAAASPDPNTTTDNQENAKREDRDE